MKENIKELEEYIDRADSEKNAADNSEIRRLRQELSEKANYEQELNEMQKGTKHGTENLKILFCMTIELLCNNICNFNNNVIDIT